MAAADPSARDRQGNGNAVLMLSLYLILLAFFILLNALSNRQEERVKATMESVNLAFSGRVELPDNSARESAASGLLPSARDLMREVGSLFRAVVPSVRPEQAARTRRVRVDIPVDEMFRPGRRLMRPNQKIMLGRLAKLLLRDTAGRVGYEIAVLHGVPGFGPPAKPESESEAGAPPAGEMPLEIRRGAQVISELRKRGIAPTAMAMGLLPGWPEIVRFEVRAFDLPGAANDASNPEPGP